MCGGQRGAACMCPCQTETCTRPVNYAAVACLATARLANKVSAAALSRRFAPTCALPVPPACCRMGPRTSAAPAAGLSQGRVGGVLPAAGPGLCCRPHQCGAVVPPVGTVHCCWAGCSSIARNVPETAACSKEDRKATPGVGISPITAFARHTVTAAGTASAMCCSRCPRFQQGQT